MKPHRSNRYTFQVRMARNLRRQNSSLTYGSQVLRQFADRIEQQIRTRGANSFGGGEWAQHSNRPHSGAPRHFDILRRVADIHAILGAGAEPPQGKVKRGRVRLFARGILAENTRGKGSLESQRVNLSADAVAAPAGHKAELKSLRQPPHHAPCSGQQFGPFRRVRRAPQPVRLTPFRARDPRRAIDFVPIRAVVLFQISFAPVDFECPKHGYVRADVRRIRIEQRAVPIEQDHPRMHRLGFHRRRVHGGRIVTEVGALRLAGKSNLTVENYLELPRSEAHRDHVVAAQRKIVKTRRVATPSRHIAFFSPHDVRGGAHLHRAEAGGPLDQRHFQFDGGARLDIARRKKVDSAGADVARHERDRIRFRPPIDARQAQRQRQRSARIPAAFFGHADGVGRHARESARSRFSRMCCCGFCEFNLTFTQRRARNLLSSPIWSSSHGTSPKPYPSVTPVRTGPPNMLARIPMVKVQTARVSYYATSAHVSEFALFAATLRYYWFFHHAYTLGARIG